MCPHALKYLYSRFWIDLPCRSSPVLAAFVATILFLPHAVAGAEFDNNNHSPNLLYNMYTVHTYSVYKCCVRSVACVGRPTSITTRASRTALTRLVRRLYLAKGGGERAAAATKNVVVEQHGGIGSS